LRTHWNGNKCAMLRHTYDHGTRMTFQVHKSNYDQQPEIDIPHIKDLQTESQKGLDNTTLMYTYE